MAVVHNIADYVQVLNYLESTGTFDTVAQAIEAGVVQSTGTGGFQVIQGGAGAPVTSFQSALEASKDPSIRATVASVATAAVTLAKQAGESAKFALTGLMTLEVPAVAAMCAPIAGVALGEGLYKENPGLWTKISQTLLPFCYAENEIQAYLDYYIDPQTGLKTPVVCVATAIIDALKSLFDNEVQFSATYEATDSAGHTVYGFNAEPIVSEWLEGYAPRGGWELVSGTSILYPNTYSNSYYIVGTSEYAGKSGSTFVLNDKTFMGNVEWGGTPNQYNPADVLNEPGVEPQYFPPTAGVSAPSVPVEPIVWPNTPIIVVPDPLGPDYQPIPVTPVTPLLPPTPETPSLPEHVPDPTPDKPDEWPEEEPWPTTIPFPVQPTEPDPDWPEVMPWPLPANPPQEWPVTPEVPEQWPEEYPTTEPWPHSPEQWPEEVPWPDTAPENWPEEIPWPDSPSEWPDEVPWPVPWPDDWPDEAPWPIKWPDDLPYPWPFPYPDPSPDPYPDPTNPKDPTKQIDPYIDPWPRTWPDPYPYPKPNPDPYRDPSQPQPRTNPDPKPYPDPDDPYPTPPKGEPTPPVPPIIPLPFSSTTGLISVYHPTQGELLSFAQWLWVTWHDATIDKIWNNPFDGVITLFELYCTPTDVGRKNIRSGFLDSGVSSETISRYTSIDCGSIGVPEYYGNYFDYSPYSKCHVYLPFIGIVELNVDDIVGHGVNVTYRIDEYNGSCIAMITCAKSTIVNGVEVDYSTVVYQFSGNCAVELPLAGGSQAAIKAGMIEAAAWGIGSVIGGVMTGGSLGSIGAELAQGAASAVHSVVSAKSSVQHSGSFGSSYGAMGAKKPYIIVTRPKQIQVPNYNELYGYQAHKMVRVGDCTGYLRCREIHVISPTASDEEKAQIEQLLKTGVYVTE